MNNLVCIKHAKYDGHTAPDLTCKACCKIYVGEIRAQAAAVQEVNRDIGILEAYNWFSAETKGSKRVAKRKP